jgi:hypothetical protein
VAFGISSSAPSSGSAVHFLQSVAVGTDFYQDFLGPDGWTGAFAGIGSGDVTLELGTTTTADFNDDPADFNTKVLTAFNSRNLNYYMQVNLSGGGGPGSYCLLYNTPIFSTADIFLLITERGGNNPYSITAFDSDNTTLGTISLPALPGIGYINTGYITSTGQAINIAVYPIDDIAPVGTGISKLRVDYPMSSDGPDGKIFFWGALCTANA